MGWKRHQVEDAAIAQQVLRDGTNLDRRSLFVSAAAFGAAAATPAVAQTRITCTAPLLQHPRLLRAKSS